GLKAELTPKRSRRRSLLFPEVHVLARDQAATQQEVADDCRPQDGCLRRGRSASPHGNSRGRLAGEISAAASQQVLIRNLKRTLSDLPRTPLPRRGPNRREQPVGGRTATKVLGG